MATLESTDTRQRILHATLRLIGEHGIGAVSNRQVAAAAGVALGSLTYHFPSQSRLLRESLLLHVAEEVSRLEAIAAELRSSSPTAATVAQEVERVVQRSAQSVEPVAELELHLRAARDPELQDASRRCFDAYEDFAAAALEALGVPEPKLHARAVVALMTGLAVRRLGTGERDASGTADALLTLVRGATASA
ncbi:MAG TPA: TetR family transcriptional regulator [Thermoleophilaceae bacterium]|nr:TetR family transcriptional regulator [Thermoleophilaceae bacterium]